ncbi:hypothetical protein BRADI_3g57915v3 [Brachypodium distachyon]|uniref:Uncharacterized protein n=1 Tax=Brachypodium distachyon TaxID=15368 RepID=A0A0Q3INH3_BRADI|nr:hypothetical protein BRADI_3g57915v3 [Brachypodium distachyon]
MAAGSSFLPAMTCRCCLPPLPPPPPPLLSSYKKEPRVTVNIFHPPEQYPIPPLRHEINRRRVPSRATGEPPRLARAGPPSTTGPALPRRRPARPAPMPADGEELGGHRPVARVWRRRVFAENACDNRTPPPARLDRGSSAPPSPPTPAEPARPPQLARHGRRGEARRVWRERVARPPAASPRSSAPHHHHQDTPAASPRSSEPHHQAAPSRAPAQRRAGARRRDPRPALTRGVWVPKVSSRHDDADQPAPPLRHLPVREASHPAPPPRRDGTGDADAEAGFPQERHPRLPLQDEDGSTPTPRRIPTSPPLHHRFLLLLLLLLLSMLKKPDVSMWSITG